MDFTVFIYTDKQPGHCSTCPCVVCFLIKVPYTMLCITLKDLVDEHSWAVKLGKVSSEDTDPLCDSR